MGKPSNSILGAIEHVLGHAAAIVIGFLLMILGLGLGVTIVMLPAGVLIALLGVAVLVAGLFVRRPS